MLWKDSLIISERGKVLWSLLYSTWDIHEQGDDFDDCAEIEYSVFEQGSLTRVLLCLDTNDPSAGSKHHQALGGLEDARTCRDAAAALVHPKNVPKNKGGKELNFS